MLLALLSWEHRNASMLASPPDYAKGSHTVVFVSIYRRTWSEGGKASEARLPVRQRPIGLQPKVSARLVDVLREALSADGRG